MATQRQRDVVIVGGGHNALVAAAMLARAGVKPLVLEARDVVGGRAVTEEIHPGFRCPTVLHAAGPLLPRVAAELDLERHGLTWLRGDVRVFAPSPDGPAVHIYDDAARTAAGLRALSPRDAERYPQFAEAFARIGAALAPALSAAPPGLEAPSARDLWGLLRSARRVRGLGRRDAYRLLRWAPMAVGDLVGEWFESDLLRATLCARGVYASFAGPRSAGTSAALLLQAALDGHATAPAVFPRGGMGALTAALERAARSLGAEIRTGARVAHIRVRDGAVRGVGLASGEEIAARAVVSGVDPRQTLLALLDASELGPGVASRARAYRCTGTAAKLNLALARLPRLAVPSSSGPAESSGDREGSPPHALTGRIHIGPTVDDLERAFDAVKYGEVSPRPTLDVTIPSIVDDSLAPPGAHVMSIHAQYVPYAPRAGAWNASRRDDLVRAIVQTLTVYFPDLPDAIVAHDLLTPVDLEAKLGLSGGHLLHGEPALDQLFCMRPLLGWAQYRTPVPGLYLCGSGTHPGAVVSGGCGANASRAILAGLRSAPAAGPGEGA
jgi:phytoene dehydrogenase-like protein